MTVYHWTTEENAEEIMTDGLREGSFVCADPAVWHGEVCLVIEDLFLREEDDVWQGITHRYVEPREIQIANLRGE